MSGMLHFDQGCILTDCKSGECPGELSVNETDILAKSNCG